MSELALNDSHELDASEAARFARLEGIVEDGLSTFVKVGSALMEIRDTRLYRETHETFEDYCGSRWSIARNRAYQLMDAAAVSKILDNPPTVESHAAELVPLLRDDEQQAVETWRELRETHGDKLTAEKVREAVDQRLRRDHTLTVMGSSEAEDWPTPQDLFDELDSEFGFQLDVCATDGNAKCATYFTSLEDGLAQTWSGVCWMNPPYGDGIGTWMRKAWEAASNGALVVCLVPARVDAGWWWEFARRGEIRFLRGRLKTGKQSWPFPSAVVVFGRPYDVKWWERRGATT